MVSMLTCIRHSLLSRKVKPGSGKLAEEFRLLLFFSLVFGVSLIFFGLFRLFLLLRYLKLAADIPAGDIGRAFLVGLRFDMVIVSYILILFFLPASFLPLSKSHKIQAAFLMILGAVFGFFFLLSTIDLEFFGAYNARLNLLAVQYLETMGPALRTIWQEYPVIPYLLLWAVVSALFIGIVFWIGQVHLGRSSCRPIWQRALLLLSGLGLLVLGARGTVSSSPINWGYAYFSQHNFPNQLALNGIFTLGRSIYQEMIEDSRSVAKKLSVTTPDEAVRTVQHLVAHPAEAFLSADYPLVRRRDFPSASTPATSAPRRPNVVIIIMESFTAEFIGVLGGAYQASPQFDRLAQEGILFDRFYANGCRTNRGLTAILCSYPGLIGLSMMQKVESQQPMLTLASVLKPLGYHNCFIYGGDLNFDNMEGFFRRHGFDRFVGQEDFPKEAFQTEWGISDEEVFHRANQEFSRLPQPFVGVVLTVSNHEPYRIPTPYAYYPPQHVQSRFLNSFKYSDYALGRFFDEARKQPYFDHTLFVIVADHGKNLNYRTDLSLNQFHIPCLFYGPKILGGSSRRRIHTIASQIDILPTLIGILRQPLVHHCWGRDLLSLSEDEGYAMLTANDEKLGLVQDGYYLVVRLGGPSSLYLVEDEPDKDRAAEFPEVVSRMERKVKIMAQAGWYIFSQRRCWKPELVAVHGGKETCNKNALIY